MANEMPNADEFKGLSRQVLRYSEAFARVVEALRTSGSADAAWAQMEELVDVDNFKREGVFLTKTSETLNWAQYKNYVTQYAGATLWEGTLRRITEVPDLVYLELEERNTRNGVTDTSNTVTIYKFNKAGKLSNLDVYVSHLS